MLDPWYLPGLAPPSEWWEGTTAAGSAFRAPLLDLDSARLVADGVRESALEARSARTTAEVVESLSRAAAKLVEGGSMAEEACQLLRLELGWSDSLTRETLAGMARSWTADALLHLVETEVGGTGPLDGFHPDPTWRGAGQRLRRAAGPHLILQVLAGNVPGVSVTATIRALLVRSGVLCKVAEPEPGLLSLFARALADEDPLLGRCVAATWWPGREFPAAWTEWAGRSGTVVVYGGEGAVAAVRRELPERTDLVTYGPGIGIAVVLTAARDAAPELARDVCAYDQQGCVSPRLVYVVDGQPRTFAEQLAAALTEEALRQSVPDPTPEEAVAIRSLRAEVEFAAQADAQTAVLTPGEDLTWTILVEEKPAVVTEALPRVVRVHGVPDVGALFEVLEPLAGGVQAVGYAGDAGLDQLAAEAARLGISRVAPLGTAAWPPPDWRHEGKHQLLPLLRWTDFETRA